MTSISSEPLGHLIDDDEDDIEGILVTKNEMHNKLISFNLIIVFEV